MQVICDSRPVSDQNQKGKKKRWDWFGLLFWPEIPFRIQSAFCAQHAYTTVDLTTSVFFVRDDLDQMFSRPSRAGTT
jgi:hypothetical protein